MNYYDLYRKYKSKYLRLRNVNQWGGSCKNEKDLFDLEDTTWSELRENVDYVEIPSNNICYKLPAISKWVFDQLDKHVEKPTGFYREEIPETVMKTILQYIEQHPEEMSPPSRTADELEDEDEDESEGEGVDDDVADIFIDEVRHQLVEKMAIEWWGILGRGGLLCIRTDNSHFLQPVGSIADIDYSNVKYIIGSSVSPDNLYYFVNLILLTFEGHHVADLLEAEQTLSVLLDPIDISDTGYFDTLFERSILFGVPREEEDKCYRLGGVDQIEEHRIDDIYNGLVNAGVELMH